jgi:hypothetical protein
VGRVRQLLLGGLITLAGTAIVQILIIPWVQTRNRRRERWEHDVIELETLLHDELPDAIAAAQASAQRYLREFRNAHPAQRISGAMAKLETTAMEDAHDLLDLVRSVSLLEKRVRLLNRRAPLWTTLQHDLVVLTDQMASASNAYQRTGQDDETHRQAWRGLQKALDKAVQTLELVAVPMKPPPTNDLSARLFRRRTQMADAGPYWTHLRRAYERQRQADTAEGPHPEGG